MSAEASKAARRRRSLVALGAAAGMAAGPLHASGLVDAIKTDDTAAAMRLVDGSGDPNAADAGASALHWAVHQGDVDVAAALLEAGARVDAVYRGGAIPVIERLVERGARLDAVNDKGWMPVTAADGVEYTPAVLKRYPEAAALLRR